MKTEDIIRLSEKKHFTLGDINPLLECPLSELLCAADRIREKHCAAGFDLCSIVNAKSGLCTEDCRFCAQSARHPTGVPVYPLKRKQELVECARKARDTGAGKYGIVTSGKKPDSTELALVAETINEIREKVGIKVCCSLGTLDPGELSLLKSAGMSRYHHNIETSPEYFPKITTTHTIGERISTVKKAKELGLEVCSGGILGIGETWQDRISMAILLKELCVDSVPVNILVPIKGTPLESISPLSAADALRAIGIFRVILKDRTIKVAAGRESVLKDFQAAAFLGGANGMLIGGYLTVSGREAGEDRKLAGEILKAWNG